MTEKERTKNNKMNILKQGWISSQHFSLLLGRIYRGFYIYPNKPVVHLEARLRDMVFVYIVCVFECVCVTRITSHHDRDGLFIFSRQDRDG